MIPPPGPHGGDGPAVAHALGINPTAVVDLSMSLNPFAPDVAALVRRHADAATRYPDQTQATRALAEAIGTDPDRLVLTNGGSEAIALVAAALGGTVAVEPEFSLHPRSGSGPRWRSNPNNPMGVLAGQNDHADVWDEAYYPMATGTWTRGDGPVVVGSLTKLFACPGLRLGYVLADDAKNLTSEQPTWPINTIALAVVPHLIAEADLAGWHRALAARRAELTSMLARHGLPVRAGDAPWVLVPDGGLRTRLAPEGIVVRDCTSFGMPGWTRIAIPGDDALATLDDALERTTHP